MLALDSSGGLHVPTLTRAGHVRVMDIWSCAAHGPWVFAQPRYGPSHVKFHLVESVGGLYLSPRNQFHNIKEARNKLAWYGRAIKRLKPKSRLASAKRALQLVARPSAAPVFGRHLSVSYTAIFGAVLAAWFGIATTLPAGVGGVAFGIGVVNSRRACRSFSRSAALTNTLSR